MPTPPWVSDPSFWAGRDLFANEYRIVNPPLRVHMLGMEGTTQSMQHAGWSLSMRQDVYQRSIQLSMRHEQMKLFALSRSMDLDYMQYSSRNHDNFYRHFVFVIDSVATKMEIVLHSSEFLSMRHPISHFEGYSPVDATPQIERLQRRSIEDFMLFRPINNTKSVIVDPNDVPQLMEMILKAQQPQQEEIRKRQRQAENMAYVIDAGLIPSQNIHAQIITVAA